MKRFVALMSLPTALAIVGCSHPQDNPSSSGQSMQSSSSGQSMQMAPGDASMSADASKASAVDVHNTVCPVSGDKVETSKLTQTYDGKTYHLCCNDCVKPFKQDPGKYAKAVSEDPSKYGVTPQKSQ
jgi:YHS domain-containing protein